MVRAVAGPGGQPVIPGPLTWHSAVTIWQFAPLVSSGLIAAAAGYLLGAAQARKRGRRPWPAGRTLAFLLGLCVIAVATQSSVGVYDDMLFSVHMVQHVLLVMVAPPLLVYGRPVTLALHSVRNPLHARIKQVVRSRLAAALTWPPAATAAYCAVVALSHTPPVMDLVLGDGAAHDAEHAGYLLAGYLFFLPVVGSEPIRWRVSIAGRYLMLLAAMMTDSFTGIVFTFQSGEVFPPYASTGRTWGPSLVSDLHLGGLVMLIGSDIAMTAVALALAARFYRDGLAAARGPRAVRSQTGPGSDPEAARLADYNAYLQRISYPGADPPDCSRGT
jgi:cytochrome c oxidase assembly factor CtaG